MITNVNDPRPGGAGGREEVHWDGGTKASIAPDPGAAQACSDRVPAAFASVFAPCVGRTMWALSYRCPHCKGTHLGRTANADRLGGIRRARCGRRIWLVVARIYRTGGAA